MYVSVIPFLLGANVFISPDPGELEHEPIEWPSMEYIYKGQIDFMAMYQTELMINGTAKGHLKCRNKYDVTLICQIIDIEVECDQAEIFEGIQEDIHNLTNAPFEITFNADGVQDITVASSLSDDNVRILQLIASLFNIGTDLAGKTEDSSTFQAKENNIFGSCDTRYNVTRFPLPDENSNNIEKNYYLRMIPWYKEDSNEGVEIFKTTDPNQCDETMNYLKERNQDGSQLSFKTLSGHMKITDRGVFKSFALFDSHYTRGTETKTPRVVTHQKLNMELDSIRETKEELPTLPSDTKTIDLFFLRFSCSK